MSNKADDSSDENTPEDKSTEERLAEKISKKHESFIDKAKEVVPDMEATKAVKPYVQCRFTFEEAKSSVITKLNKNRAFIDNDFELIDKNDRIDKTFIALPQYDGYAIGIKYGNKWVKGLFEENNKQLILKNTSPEKLLKVLDLLIQAVSNGEFDVQIKNTMLK